MTAIKSCPFCRGEARLKDAYDGRKMVACRGCHVRTSTGWESEVVAEWNRRAPVIDLDTACVLVAEGVITAGKGASLAGLGYFAFEDELAKRGIRWKS